MSSKNIKLGICQWCLPIEGPYGCKIAADIGLQGIELEFATDFEEEPLTRRYVQQAYLDAGKEWGITFPSIGVNYLCKFGMSKSKNKDIVKKTLEKAIEVACNMGIKIVQLPSFVDGDISNEEELLQTIEMLKYACQISKNTGIIIGTENALSVADNMRLIHETGYKNLKIYFDTQNPHVLKGYNSSEMVYEFGELICEVHAKDGVNGEMSSAFLGEGLSGFFETARSLKNINYSGWINLENSYALPPIGHKGEDHIKLIARDLEILKKSLA